MNKIIVMLAACFLGFFGSAEAQTQISYPVTGAEAKGGDVKLFLRNIKAFRKAGVMVELNGRCESACTLYSTLTKHGLVCAYPGTKLFFHRFFYIENIVSQDGSFVSYDTVAEPIPQQEFRFLWETYPFHVRKIIIEKSPGRGLPPAGKELVISAEELGIPRCK